MRKDSKARRAELLRLNMAKHYAKAQNGVTDKALAKLREKPYYLRYAEKMAERGCDQHENNSY